MFRRNVLVKQRNTIFFLRGVNTGGVIAASSKNEKIAAAVKAYRGKARD